MTVYVDTYRAPYGRYIMCHMVADTTDELMEMAEQLGLRDYWIQQAISLGAIEVSSKELIRIINAKRDVTIP